MEPRKFSVADAATSLVVLCTLALTVIVVRREFFAKPTLPIRGTIQAPAYVSEWAGVAAAGHRMGPDSARLTLVVFSDFECPACAHFATALVPRLSKKYPHQVKVIYRHWPLDKHRFAYPAARASECASLQGRFAEFHDTVFAQQKALGLKTFLELAKEAGVRDLTAFESCYRDTAEVAAITRDVAEVTRLRGTGTPTLLVNGWLLRGGIDPARLDSIAASLMVPTRAARPPAQ